MTQEALRVFVFASLLYKTNKRNKLDKYCCFSFGWSSFFRGCSRKAYQTLSLNSTVNYQKLQNVQTADIVLFWVLIYFLFFASRHFKTVISFSLIWKWHNPLVWSSISAQNSVSVMRRSKKQGLIFASKASKKARNFGPNLIQTLCPSTTDHNFKAQTHKTALQLSLNVGVFFMLC